MRKVLASAVIGTSAMTLFSHFISAIEEKNFSEPKTLGKLIDKLPDSSSNSKSDFYGWCAHYAIGILFVGMFSEIWTKTKIKPSITSGSVLGLMSGICGIAAWKIMFESHPNPPSKNLNSYFKHLILAHIVFGICSAITYKELSDKK